MVNKGIYISDVCDNYPASGIRKMYDLAQKYSDVVSLTVGEPNFNTPVNIVQAGKKALDEGFTHYSPNAGMPEFRQTVADIYRKRYWDECTIDNVVITCGAGEALTLALISTTEPGDEILVPDPGYPNYRGQCKIAHVIAKPVGVFESKQYKIQAEDIEASITPKTRGIILNSPSNPLGSVLNKEDIVKIAEIVKKYNLIVYSDEPYDRMILSDKEYFSMAQLADVRNQIIVINTLSKTYAMCGWRSGYMVCADKELIRKVIPMQDGLISGVPAFIQKASIEALTGPQDAVEWMKSEYRRRRDKLVSGLNKIPGFSCIMPDATFYAFVNISAFKLSSQRFAEELLEKVGLIVVPGTAFGERGEGYIRLVYAVSDEIVDEALNRFEKFSKMHFS